MENFKKTLSQYRDTKNNFDYYIDYENKAGILICCNQEYLKAFQDYFQTNCQQLKFNSLKNLKYNIYNFSNHSCLEITFNHYRTYYQNENIIIYKDKSQNEKWLSYYEDIDIKRYNYFIDSEYRNHINLSEDGELYTKELIDKKLIKQENLKVVSSFIINTYRLEGVGSTRKESIENLEEITQYFEKNKIKENKKLFNHNKEKPFQYNIKLYKLKFKNFKKQFSKDEKIKVEFKKESNKFNKKFNKAFKKQNEK